MKQALSTLAGHLGLTMLAALAWPMLCHAGPVEQTTLYHLSHLRGVQTTADDSVIARQNQQMDDAWSYFSANKAGALPVLREQLAAELRKPHPNNLVLLDVGYFLQLQDAPQDKDLSKAALLALDPTDRLVQWNIKELFRFAHLVAASHDERILPFIDKAFLRGKATVFIPQHSLRLDETLVCVFLYGVYGEGAEQHLRELLADKNVSREVMEILVWLGSPESVPAVSKAYTANPDYEHFSRMTAFMMKSGGPQGRAAMLAIPVGELDARTQEYYVEIRPAVESTSFDSLRKQFGPAGPSKLSEDQIKARLAAMKAHEGKDESTQPTDILNATLSHEFLTHELVAIRAKTFLRLSDEALSDVEMTNALANALRYRNS
jgi:hypothetical protein